MKKGDKLTCINNVSNLVGQTLFKKGKIYEVIFIDNEKPKISICLKHELSGLMCEEFNLEFIVKNFKTN